LVAKNNFVHSAANDYDFVRQEGIAADVMRRADELRDIPFDCLTSNLVSEGLVSELREATTDTRTQWLLAYSKDEEEGEANRKKAACTALQLAKASRARLKKKEKSLLKSQAPTTFEKHAEAADNAQSLVRLGEQLSEASRLVALLNAQDAC
jgi:hypothetical protein